MENQLREWLSPLIPESRRTKIILIGASAAVLVYSLTKKRYNYPPGPRGLPLVGSLLSLRNKSLLDKIPDWEKQYGPIITVDIGPLRTVIINTSDLLQETFVRKPVDFAGRPNLFSLNSFSEGGKNIVTTNYGQTWQLQRKIALKALASYMRGSRFQDTFDEVLHMVLEELRKEKDAFDIQLYTELVTINLINQICFSEMFSKDHKEFLWMRELFIKMTEGFNNGFLEDLFPPLRIWPTTSFRVVDKAFKIFLEYNIKKISEHRQTLSADKERDLTDAILLVQKKLASEESPDRLAEITDTHVAQTLTDIFTAGINTSRQTLYWTILYVAAHPDVQAKIHEEVDSVLGSRITPMASDRPYLPYTEAVLYESMRIATVVPLSIPHTTTCDTSIGEYTIPKDTFVIPNLHAIHHDPKVWEDPWKFKPERFLDSNGRIVRREGWMPFSIGKRACMAEALSKPHLHMVLVALYRNFEICMPDGVAADLDPAETGIAYLAKPYKVIIKDKLG